MMDTASLHVSVRTNPLGKREAVNYKWVGESPYIWITGRLLDDMGLPFNEKQIQIGPYKLLLVQRYFDSDQSLYVRKDRFGVLRVALYESTRLLDLVYRRLIITLAVWNLAEFHAAKIPSWQDIKILKRFAK